MARFIGEINIDDILNVAEEFKQKCLLKEKSLFSDASVWQLKYLKELKKLYIDNALEDSRDFFTKLDEQLKSSSLETNILASEIYWFMMLCPKGNITVPTKIQNINKILTIKNHAPLPQKDIYLSEKYLIGIGSPGTAFLTQIWKEFKFAILFFIALFNQNQDERKNILSSCVQLANLLCSIEKNTNPQLRYMILYLFFPDENERIFSNTARQQILSAFTHISSSQYNQLSLLEINVKLLEVRKNLEKEYATNELDFYFEPLKSRWKMMELETEFMKYLHEKIKHSTIKNYISYLKNYPYKLKHSSNQSVKVFLIKYPDEFKKIKHLFSLDPNYKELNEKYHNAFSAALGHYEKFLENRVNDSTLKDLEKEYREFLINRNENFKSCDQYVNSLRRSLTFSDDEKIKSANIFHIETLSDFDTLENSINADKNLQQKIKELNNQFSTAFKRYREFITQRTQNAGKNLKETEMKKNTILYGPPGTGKTYNTVRYAVAIIENKSLDSINAEEYQDVFNRYKKYIEDKLIDTITFHQSYGYEEFIEGIKPVMKSEEESDDENSANIQYKISDGIFKAFCKTAKESILIENNPLKIATSPTIWKVSLESTGDNETRRDCFANGHIRIGFDAYGADISSDTDFSKIGGKAILNAFINTMQIGDIVFSCYSSKIIDGIGVITGDYEWNDNYSRYKRVRKVNWIVKNIKEDIIEINNNKSMTLSTIYRLSVSLENAIKLISKYGKAQGQWRKNTNKYVFIIDEINRGNIAKIFGELITLIEEPKRLEASEETRVKLPYSSDEFGVPDNVYLLGTMNTADRSIARLDTALRRRFEFVEMLPDPKVLEGIVVEGVNIQKLFISMNKKISILYDREHTIGHSYFIPLRVSPTKELLAEIFRFKIIPLLQEYFYDDYEKIRLVLGDNRKEDSALQFISKNTPEFNNLFGDYILEEEYVYEINDKAFSSIKSYDSI